MQQLSDSNPNSFNNNNDDDDNNGLLLQFPFFPSFLIIIFSLGFFPLSI
jgi:hypothetical protein